MKNLKIYLARALLPFLCLWLIVAPSRVYAFVPAAALIPIAVTAITPEGAALAFSTATMVIGATIAFLGFGLPTAPAPKVFVPVTVSNNKVDARAPDFNYTPNLCHNDVNYGGRKCAASAKLVCELLGANGFTIYGVPWSLDNNICYVADGDRLVAGIWTANMMAIFSSDTLYEYKTRCPSGFHQYTGSPYIVAGTCFLNEKSPDSVIPDHRLYVTKGAYGFKAPPDADASGLPDYIDPLLSNGYDFTLPPIALTPDQEVFNVIRNSSLTSGGDLVINALDENNSPMTYEIIHRIDGSDGVTLYKYQSGTLPDGTEGTKISEFVISAHGVVVSVGQSVKPGKLIVVQTNVYESTSLDYSAPPNSPQSVSTVRFVEAGQVAPVTSPSSPAVASPSITPSASSSTNSGSSGQTASVTFPSDYARQGEAQTAVSTLTATVNLNDPSPPTPLEMPLFNDSNGDSVFKFLLAFKLPAHTSVCPRPTIDLSGVFGTTKVYTLDAHCALANTYFPVLNSSMMVVYTLMGLFIVLRA
jgi:hypothetical protein